MSTSFPSTPATSSAEPGTAPPPARTGHAGGGRRDDAPARALTLAQQIELRARVQAMAAEIPDNRALVRAVAQLMFEDFGVMPSGNAVYQLVRRGSINTVVDEVRAWQASLIERLRRRLAMPELPAGVAEALREAGERIWTQSVAAARSAARDELDAERARVAEREAQAAQQAGDARAEAERAKGAAAQAEATGAELARQLEAATTAARADQALLAQAQARIAALDEELRAARAAEAAAREEARQRLAGLEARLAEQEQSHRAGERHLLAQVDRERVAARRHEERARELVDQLAAERAARAETDSGWQRQVGELQGRLAALQSQLAEAKDAERGAAHDAAAARAAAHRAEGEAAAARRETERLALAVADAQRRADEAQAERERLRDEAAAARETAAALARGKPQRRDDGR